jgi:hypothetical protein
MRSPGCPVVVRCRPNAGFRPWRRQQLDSSSGGANSWKPNSGSWLDAGPGSWLEAKLWQLVGSQTLAAGWKPDSGSRVPASAAGGCRRQQPGVEPADIVRALFFFPETRRNLPSFEERRIQRAAEPNSNSLLIRTRCSFERAAHSKGHERMSIDACNGTIMAGFFAPKPQLHLRRADKYEPCGSGSPWQSVAT